ncbi:MAG: hypothetical protein U0271_46595 [Polyangiaceae bacterium]
MPSRAASMIVGVSLVVAGCAGAATSTDGADGSSSANTTASATPVADSLDPRFEADLLAIANSYTWMSRADGTSWAPLDCRAPTHPAFASRAGSGAHAKKLYTLFIKDFDAYAAATDSKRPTDRVLPVPDAIKAMPQVIVKEAWTPVEVARKKEDCPESGSRRIPSYLDNVTIDGVKYGACEPAGLFIMYRPADAARAVDEGWVYGTVALVTRPTEDVGRSLIEPRVTSAGRVASCMGCHERAPHGRLFGLQ